MFIRSAYGCESRSRGNVGSEAFWKNDKDKSDIEGKHEKALPEVSEKENSLMRKED